MNGRTALDGRENNESCRGRSRGGAIAYVSYPLLDAVHMTLRLVMTARLRPKHEDVRLENRLQGLLDLAWC